MSESIPVSSLAKTWIFDLDGTIVKHNGYLLDGEDTLLDGAKAFFDALPKQDVVIILTAREERYRAATEAFLQKNAIRYDSIFYGAAMGERILVNDKKPSGLKTAFSVNTDRDVFMKTDFVVDASL